MNATALKAMSLLLLAAAVLGAEEASPQPDACCAMEKAAVVKIFKKLGDFLEDTDLSFEDLVERISSNCDSNKDSFFDLDEFVACINDTRISDKLHEMAADVSQSCRVAVLSTMDINGDGRMGELELRVLLATIGVEWGNE